MCLCGWWIQQPAANWIETNLWQTLWRILIKYTLAPAVRFKIISTLLYTTYMHYRGTAYIFKALVGKKIYLQSIFVYIDYGCRVEVFIVQFPETISISYLGSDRGSDTLVTLELFLLNPLPSNIDLTSIPSKLSLLFGCPNSTLNIIQRSNSEKCSSAT